MAAELLRTFQPDFQHKVMVRLSRLSNIPHAAFEEAAAHFKTRISQQVEDQEINLGVKALKAIMDVMPTDADEKICNRRQLSSLDQVVAACTGNYNDRSQHIPVCCCLFIHGKSKRGRR